ncbi:MAG: Wzz/FepE/Etk N-terminal domain-containing protein [Betaproteobacteria bacterium]|jgi:LPS O-antigen subunit length determinant protein (WzzB/FepE family)|nr:Wzz/FepE/Etk N-terminal domain-containing protein [Rubrivivax sp.]
MNEQQMDADDAISLADVLQFLSEAWKTVAGTAVLSTLLGLGVAFVLPEKFEASALVEPAKVLGGYIETSNVLAEKMRSPSYYSTATLDTCAYSGKRNARREFVKDLKPQVGRQSAFVSIGMKAASPELARQCLAAVLEDVKREQADQMVQRIAVAKARLKREEERLALAERVMNSISDRTVEQARKSAGASGSEVAGSTLVFVATQAKQAEITGIKNGVDQLAMELAEPQTRQASLATPIFSPDEKVEPKRLLILVGACLGGLMLGLLVALGRKAYRAAMRARAA